MNLQGIKKRFIKVLVYFATSIIFILISSFLFLQLPAVQRLLAKQYFSSFSEVVGFKTTITNIRFSWFDRLVLEGVTIEDPEHNEMIGLKKLLVNYKISNMLQGMDINIDAIYIDSARILFTKITDADATENLNINVFINQINKQYGTSGKGGKSQKLRIGEAIIKDSKFTFDNADGDSVAGFDYNHFSLLINDAELQNFATVGDTVQFTVNTLAAIDQKTNFGIEQLSTFFRISQKSLEFRGINLKAGRSTISDTILFNYENQNDLNDFVNKVKFKANFSNTTIHPADLSLFAPAVKRLKLPIHINGKAFGSVRNFRFTEMELRTGNTVLQGSIDMDGLPDFDETFTILHLKKSQIEFSDLSFIFNENTMKRLTPLGRLSLNGQFIGYPTDFVAKGDFSNHLGRIISDINLKVNEKSLENSSYKGQLSLIGFNLGQYMADTVSFQKVNLEGSISGSGFTRDNANFVLASTIKSVGIRGYDYKNITTNARFSSQFFSGELLVRDDNMKMRAKGSIDLRNNLNLIKIQATLDSVNLDKVNIAKKRLFLQAEINVNMNGLALDSLSGNATIQNVNVNYDNKWLTLKQATLHASKNKEKRSLKFTSDIANAEVAGDFYFSQVFRDIQVLINEFHLNIRNDKNSISDYYLKKTRAPEDYEANFHINLKNIKPIASILSLDLNVGKNTSMDGAFSSGKTTVIHAFTKLDTLQYQNIRMTDVELDFNASKLSDSTQALAMVYVSSASQQIGGLNTKNFSTEAIWNSDHIDFNISIDQQIQDNYLRLAGIVDFKDSTELKFLNSSKIQLLKTIWTIDSSNHVYKKGNEWAIQNIKWINHEQSINLNGFLSENPLKKITLTVKDLNLSTLNSISQRTLGGTLNASITVGEVFAQTSIQNEIYINDLNINNFTVGDITGNNIWDAEQKKFKVDFIIDRLEKRIVNCTGYYTPSDKLNPLSIDATLEKANLKIIEPFIDQIFSNLEGTLSGEYSLTGTLNKPLLNGIGQIEKGQLMVNYLNATYQLTGSIGFRPEAIFFGGIELLDAFKNRGKLNGEISHKNFKQMQINLNASFENFQLLNTTARDNSLFYGQGYASGNVSFSGPINNLIITATAVTRKNSRIFIPMAGSSSTERKEFINFVNLKDSTYQSTVANVNKKVSLTGVTFDLNLDVTPDAYCEIIFDKKAGDIIRGRGNGRIKLQLDTKGEFNMFGPVIFTEGGYNFTLYDLINKEFTISPGSSITWFGDPYQGLMKINATYNQLASYAPILDDPTLNSIPQIRRKYPAQVLLTLEGPMLSPQIDFDILAKDLPKTITDGAKTIRLEERFDAFKSKLDEQELKRQVFSLIVLRKFSPSESFNTSGSIVNSVSELFSNQLSYWMSQVDENLEVDVDLGSMDQESFNALQLRLSYTFLNGRLRITRDGTIGNQGNTVSNTEGNNGTSFSSVAGDWTVDYLLTPDGKFKIKMYSRTNVNPVNANLNSQNAITTGVSLLYTQSFNELKDLLKSTRDKNIRKPDDNQELKEESSTTEKIN